MIAARSRATTASKPSRRRDEGTRARRDRSVSLRIVNELEFYSAAAQIIPVLLLALVLEGRLFELEERAERLPESLWIIALIGAMLAGEVAALSALAAGKAATALEDAIIMLAIFYGVVLVAALPVLPRIRALRDALPPWVAFVLENVLIFGFALLTVLAATGVIPARSLGLVLAGTVLLVLVVARGWVILSRRSK
jgi:hypothetical protein